MQAGLARAVLRGLRRGRPTASRPLAHTGRPCGASRGLASAPGHTSVLCQHTWRVAGLFSPPPRLPLRSRLKVGGGHAAGARWASANSLGQGRPTKSGEQEDGEATGDDGDSGAAKKPKKQRTLAPHKDDIVSDDDPAVPRSWFARVNHQMQVLSYHYGALAFGVHASVWATTLLSTYGLLYYGVDVKSYLVQLPLFEDSSDSVVESGGTLLAAYLLTTATGPVRAVLTIAATPAVKNVFTAWGIRTDYRLPWLRKRHKNQNNKTKSDDPDNGKSKSGTSAPPAN